MLSEKSTTTARQKAADIANQSLKMEILTQHLACATVY